MEKCTDKWHRGTGKGTRKFAKTPPSVINRLAGGLQERDRSGPRNVPYRHALHAVSMDILSLISCIHAARPSNAAVMPRQGHVSLARRLFVRPKIN